MLPEGPMIGIVACYCGDLDKGEDVLRPLGSFGSALMNSLGPMSYLDFQHSLEAPRRHTPAPSTSWTTSAVRRLGRAARNNG